MAVQNLRRIESGEQNLTLALIQRVAIALGIEVGFTVTDTGRSGAKAPTKRLIRTDKKKTLEKNSRPRDTKAAKKKASEKR